MARALFAITLVTAPLLVDAASVAGDAVLPRFQTYDVRLAGSPMPGTAFQLQCEAIVRGPAASRYAGGEAGMSVLLFFDGNDTWVLRFTPDVVGDWLWEIPSCPSNPLLQHQNGTGTCTDNPGKNATGGVMPSAANPRALVYETGAPFLSVGYEVDWLWALPTASGGGIGAGGAGEDVPTLEEFLATVRQYGFSHLLVSFYANFSAWNEHMPARVAPKVRPSLRPAAL
jgi:hypothetical protein